MTLPAFVTRIQMLEEPRLALFDADGTIWDGDIADDFTLWMIGTGRLLSGSLWDEYRRLCTVDAPAACRYLLRFYEGMLRADLIEHVETYWREFLRFEPIPEAQEVLRYLAGRGFRVWIVSGSPTDFLQPLVRQLPVEHVVGMDFEVDPRGVLTGQHAGIACAGDGKAEKVRSLWPGPIQFVAGNTSLDEAMMHLARDVAWAVRPAADLESVARREGWEITPPCQPSYGSTGWPSLADELARRGFPVPPEPRACEA